MTDLPDSLEHHTRNLALVLEGILLRDEPMKDKARKIKHRCGQFLECLESLTVEKEEDGSNRKDKEP